MRSVDYLPSSQRGTKRAREDAARERRREDVKRMYQYGPHPAMTAIDPLVSHPIAMSDAKWGGLPSRLEARPGETPAALAARQRAYAEALAQQRDNESRTDRATFLATPAPARRGRGIDRARRRGRRLFE